MYMLPLIVAELDADKNRNIVGQIGFFDEGSQFSGMNEMSAPDLEEFPYNELLKYEKEITGLYISGHPMDEYKDLSEKIRADRIIDILESDGLMSSKYKDNSRVSVFGIISKVEKKITKNNSTMCFVVLEDLTATIECIVFSKQYADSVMHLQAGNIVLVEGRLSLREDREPSVICERIRANPKNLYKDTADMTANKKKRRGIFIRYSSKDKQSETKLNIMLDVFKGDFPIYSYHTDTEKYKLSGYICNQNPVMVELKHIFGDENVVIRQ